MTKEWCKQVVKTCGIFVFLLIASSASALGQEKEIYEIGILGDAFTPESDSILIQLENEIRAVVGEDAEILFPQSSILVSNLDEGLAELRGRFEDEPQILAELQTTMGNVYHELGLLPQAEGLLEDAVETRKATLGTSDPETWVAMQSLASLYQLPQKYEVVRRGLEAKGIKD